ncbi:hypothetical protein [Pseudomonas syringae]|uniref:hypothetical protein n=1 Tax=Pseudomonas syringae TaxID=317 RepID=UPI0012AE267F|nr:hypothetical protein [Pseudomonas syringae]
MNDRFEINHCIVDVFCIEGGAVVKAQPTYIIDKLTEGIVGCTVTWPRPAEEIENQPD